MDHRTLQIPCPHFCHPQAEPGAVFALEEPNQSPTLGGSSREQQQQQQLGAVPKQGAAGASLCASTTAGNKPNPREGRDMAVVTKTGPGEGF